MPDTLPFTPDLSVKPEVQGFFDPDTNTISYLVKDPGSKACAIVDSVLDLDYAAGRVSHVSADRIIAAVRAQGLELAWQIETHAHADHLSAAPYIKAQLGGRIGIGAKIAVVQEVFGQVFDEGPAFRRDGSQFDHLFQEGERYRIGGMTGVAIATPGHTPARLTHVIGDAPFGGDARVLYRSIKRVLSLPPRTRLFMCHDYAPGGREIRWETTVAEERAQNIHVRDGVSEEEFVALRSARDKTLGMPRLIIPAIQVNMKAGQMPAPAPSGKRFLKVPLDVF